MKTFTEYLNESEETDIKKGFSSLIKDATLEKIDDLHRIAFNEREFILCRPLLKNTTKSKFKLYIYVKNGICVKAFTPSKLKIDFSSIEGVKYDVFEWKYNQYFPSDVYVDSKIRPFAYRVVRKSKVNQQSKDDIDDLLAMLSKGYSI